MFTFFTRIVVFCFAFSPVFSYSASNTPTDTLSVGVLPYMSTRTLITTYEPLRLHLEKSLGRPVQLFTSTSFKQFFINSKQGEYDIVISAPNFARMLQTDHGFTPLVRYANGGQALIMVPRNSTIQSPKDLHGKILAVPDKLAIISIVGMSELREEGLKSGTDFKILEVPSFASAILTTSKGEADATISAQAALAQMPAEMRDSVRSILTSKEFVSQIFMSNPKLAPADTETIKAALLSFGTESEAGKRFLEQTRFKAIIPVSSKDMSSLDNFVIETRHLMEN